MTYVEYISFVTIDAVEYAHMAPALGVEAGVFPALALQNPRLGQVFPYHGNKITPQVVEKFVQDIVEGRIQPDSNGPGVKHTEL